MKIKKLNILLPFFLLVGCSNNNQVMDKNISIASFQYSDGKNVVSLDGGYRSFNIYQKNKSDDKYLFYKSIKSSTFSYEGINLDIKIVPVSKDKEILDKAIEYNFFDNIFKNEFVTVFDDDLKDEYIQNIIDSTSDRLMTEEWSNERHSFLFLPGNYSNITAKAGYYTSISGLGKAPLDVVLNKLEVHNHPGTKNALINFWRSVENFDCKEDSMWAVSQAAPARRMSFEKNLHLSDFQDGHQNWSSGGFLANSFIQGWINNGSQQQYYIRNTKSGSFGYSNFNNVYEGVNGTIPFESWSKTHATIIDKTFSIIDKPNLIFDSKLGLGVNVYEKRENSKSYSWSDLKDENAKFIPIDKFEIITPKTQVSEINSAINKGKNIIFTPGIYDIDQTININKEGIIILGMGLATLRCRNNESIMKVNNVSANISGLIFQSGQSSKNLLELNGDSSVKDTYLGDVFFRAGGEDTDNTFVETALEVNQSNAIFDNLWIWRADHGNNIAWEKNVANQGIVVNGDNNLFHCLMVEHFEKYQTSFFGNDNKVIFYQSETPYDALTQEVWGRGKEQKDWGFASYFVDESVKSHYGIGLGVYFHSIASQDVFCFNAYKAPKSENINLKNMVIRRFSNKGGFIHFINDIDGEIEGEEKDCNFYLENF